MRAVVLAFALVAFAGSALAQSETTQTGNELTDLSTMSAMQLRDWSCGGADSPGSQDVRNIKFIGCVMFVLGAVEMLREWQRAGGPKVCIPRNARAGDLIIAVQQYIEEKQAWKNSTDATTVIVQAVKVRWPC